MAATGVSSGSMATAARLYEGYAITAPGANTGIITGGVKFSHKASRCRVLVVLATGSVFNYSVTDGTTAYKVGLNESSALNASDAYEFEFDVGATDDGLSSGTALTYNFEVETDGVIRQLIVTQVTGP